MCRSNGELDDGVGIPNQIDAFDDELTEGMRLEAMLRRCYLEGEDGITKWAGVQDPG